MEHHGGQKLTKVRACYLGYSTHRKCRRGVRAGDEDRPMRPNSFLGCRARVGGQQVGPAQTGPFRFVLVHEFAALWGQSLVELDFCLRHRAADVLGADLV